MFDSIKGLSGLTDALKPDKLDLGSFDKAANWLRDSSWAAKSCGLSNVRIKELLDSWLSFASDLDDICDLEMIALCGLASVILYQVSDGEILDHFNVLSYFDEV